MQINLQALEMREAYKLLTGVIVPRPIGWVSTLNRNGVRNLAPFSFFNGVSIVPPTVSVSIYNAPPGPGRTDGIKDTLRNIKTTGEFVVHIVSESLREAMNVTATDFPPDMDEFAMVGLEAVESEKVRPERIAEAAVAMECRLHGLMPVGRGFGGATLVVGEVVLLHLRDDIVNERNHVDIHALQPIARIGGPEYVFVRDTFTMDRPQYE